MAAVSRTLGSPLSSPQIEPLDTFAACFDSPNDRHSLASFPRSPSPRLQHMALPRTVQSASEVEDEREEPQFSLFQLLQKNRRQSDMESDDDAESRRRSSVFGLGLFRELPEEDRLEQLKAQAEFAFECPVCGNEDVQFWSRGRTAGQAECQNSACGHRWMWKPTTKMLRDGTTFEPNMPLPPKTSSAPAAKRRKLKGNSSDLATPSYPRTMPEPSNAYAPNYPVPQQSLPRDMYVASNAHETYNLIPPRRIPPEVSLENRTAEYGPNRDVEFYNNYNRFFSGRPSEVSQSSEQQLAFPATKFPEPVDRSKPGPPTNEYPIDEEDEIFQSELLELELRRREIEAKREAHRARQSQLLLQQRREQLREQSLARHRQTLNVILSDDDTDTTAPGNRKQAHSNATDNFNNQSKDISESATESPPKNITAEESSDQNIHAQGAHSNTEHNASGSADNHPEPAADGSDSDQYMFSDDDVEMSEKRAGKQPVKETKTVKPVIQVDNALGADANDGRPSPDSDEDMMDDDKLIEEAYGFYFSDEEEEVPYVPTGTGVRKQPVWTRASDVEPSDQESVASESASEIAAESEYLPQTAPEVAVEKASSAATVQVSDSEVAPSAVQGPKKRRGRPPNPNKIPKAPREPKRSKPTAATESNEPAKKKGRKPSGEKREGQYKKKPMNSFNAYLLFNRDMRRRIAIEQNVKTPSEVSKLISEAWKNISKEEKQKYIDEMNQKRKELGLREAAPVDNNTPKGVPNPFVLFNVEQRPKLKDQHPGMSTAEMNQLVTNGWKALTQAEKKVYYDKSKKIKEELLKKNPGFKRRRRLKPEELRKIKTVPVDPSGVKRKPGRPKKIRP